MRFAPELTGPSDPVDVTAPRRPGSLRRTTSIDMTRPDGPAGRTLVDARARDLVTAADGSAKVQGAAAMTVALDTAGLITEIGAAPGTPAPPATVDLAALVGADTRAAFRRDVAAAASGDAEVGGLWHLLLDDLVGARIVSGLAQQHEEVLLGGGPMHEGIYADVDLLFEVQAGVCAGWDEDATMLRELRHEGSLPVSVGPLAHDLSSGDELAWHDVAPLTTHSVRRQRLMDLGPLADGGTASVDAHFRDSHVAGDGTWRVVHEYTAHGKLDVEAAELTDLTAEARVLPWPECPAAAASAGWAVGVPLGELRQRARGELRGVGTCTHLNDVIRALADLPHMSSPVANAS
ncbi:MAG: DUF2889 domain-containing protein [Actinomycetia bacterium]|nr:DUF2889 domain-containing protein [Actinomycetes bacterium]